jgi:hypothetical protein
VTGPAPGAAPAHALYVSSTPGNGTVVPAAPARAAPARAAPVFNEDVRPHNLPRQVTGFVGRGRELAAVQGLLASSRAA